MLSRFEQFCTSIFVIHRNIQKIERVEMAKYGLKGPHAQCLVTMNRFPEGITASQLCDITEKDKAAISRTLAELEKAGLIARRDPEGKHYRARLQLTETGKSVAANVNHLVYRAVKQASGGYTPQERQVFVHVLEQIAGNLQNICDGGLEEEKEYSV